MRLWKWYLLFHFVCAEPGSRKAFFNWVSSVACHNVDCVAVDGMVVGVAAETVVVAAAADDVVVGASFAVVAVMVVAVNVEQVLLD